MRLFPYQEDGVSFLVEAERAILADEPGLGKTAQALIASRGTTLIVGPAAFESIWRNSIVIWRDELHPGANFTYTSYHKLKHHANSTWDTVIFDEAHHIKNRKANWTVAAFTLKSDRMYLLTGTPIPNWSHELYCLLKMLYPGDRRFSSYWRWIGRWFVVYKPPWGGTQIKSLQPGLTWTDFAIENGLQGRWLRRLRDDVQSELPALRQETIELPMLTRQGRVYRDVKRDMYHMLDTGREILVWSTGGLYTKLHRISTGIELEDPESPSSNKLDMLESMLVDRTSSTLVVCRFRDTVIQIQRRLPDSMVITGAIEPKLRHGVVSRFQQEGGVMAATIDTIGEGYTITEADTVIFVERHPAPHKNEQTKRRIHRIGQHRPCLSVDLVSSGTVDERLSTLLASKTAEQMRFLTSADLV